VDIDVSVDLIHHRAEAQPPASLAMSRLPSAASRTAEVKLSRSLSLKTSASSMMTPSRSR
jgi:hypothetical protein